MKIADLTQALEEDFIWRRREILALTKLLADSVDDDTRLTLMRAALTLYYAHWEGFIKFSAQCYLNFVCRTTKRFDKLSDNFIWIMSKKETDNFYSSKRSTKDHISIMINIINRRSSMDVNLFHDKIDTGSNLKEKILDNICAVIGLDIDKSKYEIQLICNNLLERRNKVAHGSIIEASPEKIVQYRNAVLSAMNEFTYDIVEMANTETYLSEKERQRRTKIRERRRASGSETLPLELA